MYFAYGNFSHDANTVALSVTQYTDHGTRGRPLTTKRTFTLDGVLLPDLSSNPTTPSQYQALIKTKIDAMRAAYSTHGKNAGLYHDDGTRSSHFLDNSTSLGGVRVLNVDFPDGQGETGQYATRRTFRIVLEAEYAANGDQLIAFQETLDFVGTCGRRWLYVETRDGEPQEQTVNTRTVQFITQTGSAVGLLSRPFIPSPVLPAYEDETRRRVTPGSPEYRNGKFINWPIAWSYSFQVATPQLLEPNRR